jgi:uncharacterized protein
VFIVKAGIGYRRPLRSGIVAHQESIDCLEIITEQFLPLTPSRRWELEELLQSFTLLPHGLKLSIGSVDRPNQTYLDDIARVLEVVNPPYYSDHFAITGTSEVDIGHLSPMWFTEEALDVVVRNINQVRDFLKIPLVFETITHPFYLPGATMSQEQFISEVCSATGCGILLDVVNIYINAMNLGGDAKEFVRGLPLESVRQLHIVGYSTDDSGFLIDGHSNGIQPEVWSLYDDIMSVCRPEFVVIERDANFPGISELVEEVEHARIAALKVLR